MICPGRGRMGRHEADSLEAQARPASGATRAAGNGIFPMPDNTRVKIEALQNAIYRNVNFSHIATDEKGIIQIFNAGAERMLGYKASEVVGKITPADLSDPQELIARQGVEHRIQHPHCARFRSTGFQGLARDRRHL